jgi:hypothetical protein
MIQFTISSEEQTETSDMADDLVPQLGRVAGVRARRMQEPVPGIASEPITTAILVAIVAEFAYKGVSEIWSIVRKRVLKSRRPAKITVDTPGTQGSERIVIVITPTLADAEKVPAVLSQALGLSAGD